MPLETVTVHALVTGAVHDPFSILGLHAEGSTWWIRAWVRDATACTLVPRDGGPETELKLRHEAGLFEAALPGRTERFAYDLKIVRQGREGRDGREGRESQPAELIPDIYAFWTQLPTFDLDLFRAGRHHHLGDILGAQALTIDGVAGVRFAVWAPNASRVSVVGDWNRFDGTAHPMRPRQPYGVWEIFLPGVAPGMLYKYEVRSPTGTLRIKADPYAWEAEKSPATASIVPQLDTYAWSDQPWILERATVDHLTRPMAIYEVHLGSWHRGREPDAWPNYRVIGQELIRYALALGFTHIELLPLAQHPFEGSWGYQVTGQYAPNSRHGSPDDLKWFVDQCHQAGLGVIVDFVPGHFPKDDFSLAAFDGTPCYEYADPREGEHKTWGTLVFNFSRPEVRNFLLAAALHWCRRFHIDGLRVDAVSSMLYRNYDREPGAWVANNQGGTSNDEAVTFLQELTTTVRGQFPGVLTIAEESTAWPGVTAPTELGGLGFDLKWNMGWMHDTLGYLSQDPLMRSGCHNRITFHQWYAYDDKWVLPLSHDEVVHGKHSLIDKLPGDWWRKRAQLRLMLGYQVAVPGRKLLFQGGEFGQGREFAWDRTVDWDEAAEPERRGVTAFLARCLGLYRSEPALFRRDDHRDGFHWTDHTNSAESVLAFLRRAPGARDILVVCNFTPVPRHSYRLGVPMTGAWELLVCSDDLAFGGSGVGVGAHAHAVAHPHHELPASFAWDLPPLGICFFRAPLSPVVPGDQA
jgi:1,4-alpha-glucan branching enzyme